MDKIKHYLAMLGPGLLFAGAAIGVSHLVQATRAGANYGFAMLWAVILILLFKYPFFEYGTRYTASKGETLLAGYKRMGKWVLWAYILLTPLTMFTIQAAVTAVAGGARECRVTGVWAPNIGVPLDVIWQMDGRGPRLPGEWFAHGAIVDRSDAGVIGHELARGRHFVDLANQWNCSVHADHAKRAAA